MQSMPCGSVRALVRHSLVLLALAALAACSEPFGPPRSAYQAPRYGAPCSEVTLGEREVQVERECTGSVGGGPRHYRTFR